MLAAYSTLASRARRNKQALPFFVTETPEIMQGVMLEVRRARRDCVLGIDVSANVAHVLPVTQLLANALYQANIGSLSVGVQVIVPPELEMVKELLHRHVSMLTIKMPKRRLTHDLALIQKCAEYAHAHDAVLSLAFDTVRPPAELAEFSHAAGIAAVHLPIISTHLGRPAVSLDYLSGVTQAARVPIIASEVLEGRLALKRALPAGITGFTVSDELAHAYTAGIRTALRNRSLEHPASYQKMAVHAVAQVAKRYLEHIN